MTVDEVLKELEAYGNPSTKKVFLGHGAREPFFGVKVGDLKKIQKKVKKDHPLALNLYATGNSDAMYLAGLIADENLMTKKDLQKWAEEAYWYMISEYTVPWLASETPYGFEIGQEWIDSNRANIASSGWATLANYASIMSDADLNLAAYSKLLERVEKTVHQSPNRVRFTMNGFVIAIGSYMHALTAKATAVAQKIGKVDVVMGSKACKVPLATEYIQKIIDKDRVGVKRKKARC